MQLGAYATTAGLRNFDITNTSTADNYHGSLIRLISSNAAGNSTASYDIVKYKEGTVSHNNNESGGSINFYAGGATRVIFDSSGNLRFNSAYGSVQVAYGVRAWVFVNNSSGQMGIFGSGGVSSTDDLGVGSGRVNFSFTMPDTSYSIVSSAQRQGTYDMLNVGFSNGTASFRFDSFNNGSSGTADLPSYSFAIVR